jgi:oxygen-independent coproporphyrinogen-3 oxidase
MRPLSVYVHIPFCTVKCGYCDFNAFAGLDRLKPGYADALLAEVMGWGPVLAGRTIASISFGGGTPNEVSPGVIAGVIAAVRHHAPFAGEVEISIEANPGSASTGQFRSLARAGVNRVSFGAQSFDAAELTFLDRIHSVEAIYASVQLARRGGIRNVGLDLMYGIPGQPLARWDETLSDALALEPEHISCYCLTVEEGTPLAARIARGHAEAPDPDVAATMYECAMDRLAAAGYRHYELSNWALPGFESRHNLGYWTDREYLGVGAGAHGYLDGERYENVAHPAAYIARVTRPTDAERALGPAIRTRSAPGPITRAFDFVETALRLSEGLDLVTFARAFGHPLDGLCGDALARCSEAGLLELDGSHIRLTRRGKLLHSEVCAHLLADLERSALAAAV